MENRYFLIEKKIKDLISYINIYSKHLPKHEKYVLGEKLRRLSYEILELAITVNKKVFKKTDLTQLNIKHEILKKYENIIKCKNTIKILKEFIFRNDFFNQGEMQVYIDDSLVGICIGNYTAQIGANLTLNSTDHFIKRTLKCKYYLRYMDDMIILDSNKDKLNYIFSEVTKFLHIEELKVNPKSGIGKLKQGVDFVGFRTWKNKRLIRKQSLFRIRRSLKKGFNHNQVCSFLAHAKDTNSLNYIKNIIDKYKESSNVNS